MRLIVDSPYPYDPAVDIRAIAAGPGVIMQVMEPFPACATPATHTFTNMDRYAGSVDELRRKSIERLWGFLNRKERGRRAKLDRNPR